MCLPTQLWFYDLYNELNADNKRTIESQAGCSKAYQYRINTGVTIYKSSLARWVSNYLIIPAAVQ